MPPDDRRRLLVTYDLSTADDARLASIISILKECDGWWHYVDCTWLVITDETPDALTDKIKPYLQPADRLLIVTLPKRPEVQGWLPQKAWDWVHANINRGNI